MVELLICCSEHDVSMCFSEYGGTLLMSWRIEEEGFLGVEYCLGGCGISELWSWTSFFSSLGKINHSAWNPEAGGKTQTWGQGTRPRGRTPEPGGRNPEPGSRNLEAGSWRLREFHHGIKLLVEFGVGRRIVARVFKLPYRICFNGHVFGLSEDGHMDVVVPLIPMAWKWITRKTIMHDLVNALRAYITVAQDQVESLYSALVQAGLQFAFLEALWFHESCVGVYVSGPRNSEIENLGEAKD
ncbi:hypothetical protein F2Q69_00021408 [Brassica cretica]|uniref:Uncharacterized protein n=1 Tax=Brassica cretica TaxID=69181 RepID=A0A8S9Q1R8_BRACR|nr:hypothetical protein F2Q69_00021408 [Brassica cretica]